MQGRTKAIIITAQISKCDNSMFPLQQVTTLVHLSANADSRIEQEVFMPNHQIIS
jgi:hypothetical protein